MNTQHHESQHRLAIDLLRIIRGLRTKQQTQDEVRRKIFIPMGNLTANKISLQRIDRLQAAEYRAKELYNELIQELTVPGQCRCKYPIGQTKQWVCNICGKVDNEVESRNILEL